MLEGFFQEEEEASVWFDFAQVPLAVLTRRRPSSLPQPSSTYSTESEATRAPFE